MYDENFLKDHISVQHVGDSGMVDITDESLNQFMQKLQGSPDPSEDADSADDSILSDDDLLEEPKRDPLEIPLTEFVEEFGDSLLKTLNESNPPVFTGNIKPSRQAVLDGLNRKLFQVQAKAVHAAAAVIMDQGESAAIINGEMGCGKTTIGIAIAAVLAMEGLKRTLVLSPPHLVYKWRREILETIPNARVWVLNGPDTLVKLIKLREQLGIPAQANEFYVMGRVRMRMGFHWRPVSNHRFVEGLYAASCPHCGEVVRNVDGEPVSVSDFSKEENRRKCTHCEAPLWTLMRPKTLRGEEQSRALIKALQRIPTIGEATSKRLIEKFGETFLYSVLGDNIHEFINIMDEKGDLFFSDRQAQRMERAMANMEFGFGEGGYQPSEFVKRYLPQGYFGLCIADEAHEYKNVGSAQGQAMGVLAAKSQKSLLLTGTLMGGYGDDLFYLLFRVLTRRMIQEGYRPSASGSLTTAGMSFMRDHGVLKDIYSESASAHKTARGSRVSVRTVKAPGFSPQGIMRCVLPYTIFVKLKEIDNGVLPSYEEEFRSVKMESEQDDHYQRLSMTLTSELKQALARRDTTLLGTVLNALLAWPDSCFRPEHVVHPRLKHTLAATPSMFGDFKAAPKERELIDICKAEKEQGRKVLAYTIYTGKRDTTSRLKVLLEQEGLKTAVLRSTVSPERREDWIAEQVDRGVDVVITNPELVKTGLDLLDFATIVFMQSGYNVYVRPEVA